MIDNVPKLRFPEFTDDWQVKRLGDISSEVIDKVGDRNVETYSITAGVGFVSQTEKFGKDISGSQNPRYTMLSPNELSYNKGNSKTYQYGCVYRNPFDHEIAVPNVFISFKFSDGNSAGFYEQLFIGHYLDRYLRRIISSGARMDGLLNVGKRDFFDIKIPAPSKKEQEKIADFLTTVDEKIAKLEQKQDSLETYKRGVMQQIFSQKIRFTKPDGSNYPDWQTKKLGEIGSTYNGLTGKSGEDFGSGKPYITYMQIFSDSKIDENYSLVKVKDGEKQNTVQRGDIFFTTSSETPEETGYTSVLLREVEELYLNSFCFGYRADKRILLPDFAQFLFHSNAVRSSIIRLAQGSTRYNISKIEMMKLDIELPNIEEQQKIADFLSAVDSKIQLNNDIIQKAKQFKKSLLQRMFV